MSHCILAPVRMQDEMAIWRGSVEIGRTEYLMTIDGAR
jgi:hypothetical protein